MTAQPPVGHRIFAVGETLWDLLEDGKQLGGAAANFIYFTTAMGASANLVSRVGTDPLGDETIARLQQLGLKTDWITRDTSHETGTASVELDQQRNARFIIHQPAAWDFIPAEPAILRELHSASAICFGTLAQRNGVSRDSIREMVRCVPSEALRILDINLRKPFYNVEILEQSMKLANVLKINHEELEIIAELFDIDGDEVGRLRALADRFDLQCIALTKGAQGSLLLHGDRVSSHPVVPVPYIKDTIGAGDSFTAALVMGLLQNEDLDLLHDRAARLASYVCTQPGATPPLPSWF